MSNYTRRDRIWNQALKKALADESFSLNQIQRDVSEPVSSHILKDTLSSMVDQGWLSKEQSEPVVWVPGSQIPGEKNGEEIHEQHTSPKKVTEVTSLVEGKEYVGVVDRFSTSGNANVRLPEHMDRTFVNLGPIYESSEGESVVFRFLETGWGECLTEKYTYDGYSPRDGMKHSEGPASSSSQTSSTSNSSPHRSHSNHSSNNSFTELNNRNDLINGPM
ncbi:hypothetical protein [Haloarcula laminariae]|uniref:hypothetical protein n=1 Tax=Haloarcula laminariae TaxID=2961577 RepID=UPI0021C6F88A|nr:hypothetical protein [Halomicroarcula laminariae]